MITGPSEYFGGTVDVGLRCPAKTITERHHRHLDPLSGVLAPCSNASLNHWNLERSCVRVAAQMFSPIRGTSTFSSLLVWSLLLQDASEGPTFIFCTARALQ